LFLIWYFLLLFIFAIHRLSENGLHADLSPEAQGEALRKAMVEAARARSARGPGDEAADGDSEEQDEPSQPGADAASLPLLDAAPHAHPPPAEMCRAEMERRGLHAQQDEMERLKAESERKIQEFEAQQKSVALERSCLDRGARSHRATSALVSHTAVADLTLFLFLFFLVHSSFSLRLLREEIESERSVLSECDARVAQAQLQHGVLSERRDQRALALRSLQAHHAHLVGPLSAKLRAQSLALESSLAAQHDDLSRRKAALAEKKSTLAGLVEKISDLSKIEEMRNQQVRWSSGTGRWKKRSRGLAVFVRFFLFFPLLF
jgi:hypothetical protein